VVGVPVNPQGLEVDALGGLVAAGLRGGTLSLRGYGDGKVDEGGDYEDERAIATRQ
jgi:hypothetical protein